MKTLLIVCGAGHATSTIAVAKVADELNKIDDYDAVISTTIVSESIKDKVINGLPLLTGLGVEQLYKDLKERLGL